MTISQNKTVIAPALILLLALLVLASGNASEKYPTTSEGPRANDEYPTDFMLTPTGELAGMVPVPSTTTTYNYEVDGSKLVITVEPPDSMLGVRVHGTIEKNGEGISGKQIEAATLTKDGQKILARELIPVSEGGFDREIYAIGKNSKIVPEQIGIKI